MRVLLDTSAVLAVACDEATKPALVAATRGATLLAPSSLPLEVGNALSAMFKRRRLALADAHRALAAYERLPIRLVPVDVAAALDLSDALGVYAYDAYQLVAARSEHAALLTLDRGLQQAAAQAGVALLPLPAP